MKTQMEEEE